MKKIILDMDGVVVATKRISHYPGCLIFLAVVFFHWLFLLFPARIQKNLFEEHRVIIVSKRPAFCKWVTVLWFKIRGYPVEAVHCVGLNGDKKEIAERIDPDIIIDDRMNQNYGLKNFYFKEEEI